VLKHPDRPGPLAEDLGDLRGIEAGDDSQEHGVRLVGRQEIGDQPADVVGGQRVEDGALGVVRGGDGEQGVGRHRFGLAATATATVVDDAAPGDGERPAFEGVLVALESGQVASNAEPDLGRQVFGVSGFEGAQVADERGMQIPVQDRYGPLCSLSGRGQYFFERRFQCYRSSSVGLLRIPISAGEVTRAILARALSDEAM